VGENAGSGKPKGRQTRHGWVEERFKAHEKPWDLEKAKNFESD
jgi:hypothetical protein